MEMENFNILFLIPSIIDKVTYLDVVIYHVLIFESDQVYISWHEWRRLHIVSLAGVFQSSCGSQLNRIFWEDF